jgi:hypothetical protein
MANRFARNETQEQIEAGKAAVRARQDAEAEASRERWAAAHDAMAARYVAEGNIAAAQACWVQAANARGRWDDETVFRG